MQKTTRSKSQNLRARGQVQKDDLNWFITDRIAHFKLLDDSQSLNLTILLVTFKFSRTSSIHPQFWILYLISILNKAMATGKILKKF